MITGKGNQHSNAMSCIVNRYLKTVMTSLILLLVAANVIHGNSLKIGLITRQVYSSKQHIDDSLQDNVIIQKHVIDTSDVYQLYKTIQTLEEDPSIGTVVLLDDNGLENHSRGNLVPKNKKLIRWIINNDVYQQIEYDNNAGCYNRCTHEHSLHCVTTQHIPSMNMSSDLRISKFVPEVVLSPIKSLSWKHAIILYESSTEMETSELVDKLSEEGILFVMYNIEHVTDVHQLLHILYVNRVHDEPIDNDMNIIVVCKLFYTNLILQTAENFDHSNSGKKTLLKKFSRWFIVGYDYCSCIYDTLQVTARDLDNVAVVAIPTEKRTAEDFFKVLNTIVYDVKTKQHEDDNMDFAGTVNEMLLEATKGSCLGYKIDTLMWRETGREFTNIGHVYIDGHLEIHSDIFPNINHGYNKRNFLLSTLPYPPFVIKIKTNGTVTYEGYCIDLLKELARILNFTYTIIEPADGLWGDYVSKENFTFNGLVGQLQRQEIDMVAAPISEQPERHQVMDFSYPFFYEYTTVVVKKPDPSALKWRKLLDPLKWRVLISVGAALPVVTILIFLIEKYTPYYSTKEHAKERDENGGLHTWHSAFWYMYGALLCQGGVHLPYSVSGRTLVSFWWLFCIIIVGTYCGNLIAFLTVTKETAPFNTLTEMLDQKNVYKWGTLGGSNWDMIFRTTTNPTYRSVGDGMAEFNKSDPDVLNPSVGAHIKKVMRGQYAWIGDKTSIELAMFEECDLIAIKEMFIPMSYAFGFTDHSPLGPLFLPHMIKIQESGLLHIWKRKWWPKANFCSGSMVASAKPISLEDVQSAFYVCCIGIVLGLVVLSFEIVIHRCRKWIRRLKGRSEVSNEF